MSTSFEKALHNFTTDVASAGAVRHLTDMGYSITEIAPLLDYPLSLNIISEIVWKHLITKGIICLDKPSEDGTIRKVTYIKEQGAYGRTSFIQQIEESPLPSKEYVKCNFGLELYKNKEQFEQRIARLDKRDREYVLLLPWPKVSVYHIKDDKILRIMALLESK